jgi:hypothetical protein
MRKGLLPNAFKWWWASQTFPCCTLIFIFILLSSSSSAAEEVVKSNNLKLSSFLSRDPVENEGREMSWGLIIIRHGPTDRTRLFLPSPQLYNSVLIQSTLLLPNFSFLMRMRRMNCDVDGREVLEELLINVFSGNRMGVVSFWLRRILWVWDVPIPIQI